MKTVEKHEGSEGMTEGELKLSSKLEKIGQKQEGVHLLMKRRVGLLG